jgi:hypothetical protein
VPAAGTNQEAVSEKSVEVTAIALLLQRLALTGLTEALVTIDAMAPGPRPPRRSWMAVAMSWPSRIWPAICTEIDQILAAALILQRCGTIRGEHGRIEIRHPAICHDISWLISNRCHPGAFRFPDLAAIEFCRFEVGQFEIALQLHSMDGYPPPLVGRV